ncbi:endonuclease/exonuclease/phosphatase family protein [Reyranella sp.]|uniref:endonuclease/exonuclease/phosphatase family protein n=1 Tax=Reyranella sp. TaxID=1929291 RepID=UPI003BA997CB
MIEWIGIGAAVLCGLMTAATALALIDTDKWWIRVLDFPRLQFAAVLLGALVVTAATRPGGAVALAVLAAGGVALAWQVRVILPYTPLWKRQMRAAPGAPDAERVRLLIANVLQDNRDSARLLRRIEETDPDLILLTEIDGRWTRELARLAETHPHTILEPRPNTYGIGLWSRLRLAGGEVRHLLYDDIPSIRTQVALDSGATFTLWAVHPSPPRPGDDTAERDAELLVVAKEAAATPGPAIVTGDLNDVAWSETTSLFQRISGLLDPRVGRGFYATFNANWPLLRWPLDHLFASRDWTLGEFRRLGPIGSDHFPILVELHHHREAAAGQERQHEKPGDAEKAEEHIADGREAASGA